MKLIGAIALLLSLVLNENTKANNRLIIPNEKFGEITANSSERGLILLYGRSNVLKDSVSLGEGIYEKGTKIFPNTNDEITITWKDKKNKKNPQFIELRGEKSNWKTKEGITLGTSLKTLEIFNGSPFKL